VVLGQQRMSWLRARKAVESLRSRTFIIQLFLHKSRTAPVPSWHVFQIFMVNAKRSRQDVPCGTGGL